MLMYLGICIISLVESVVGLVWDVVEVFLIDGFVLIILSFMFIGKFNVIGILFMIIIWILLVFLLMNSVLFLIFFLFKW